MKEQRKAIFMDRDGTINQHVGYIIKAEQFVLLPNISKAIDIIHSQGYLAIIITNQSIIARGYATIEEVDRIHQKMKEILKTENSYVDAIYMCPHHPTHGRIKEFSCECECRKPKAGLILRAAKDLNINLGQSWMIGDSKVDIEAGIKAGCKTALISTHEDYFGQTVTVDSLYQFTALILNKEGDGQIE